MKMDPLSRLAVRNGGDKFGAHLYTPIYHKMFRKLRDKPIRLLEIGVGGQQDPDAGGSSLMMWAEYFLAGVIIGVDIASKRLQLPSRVKVVQGSQDDPALLQQIVTQYGPFDIVVDDGSHHNELTKKTFRLLYPTLRARGIYAVEDTQTAFHPNSAGDVTGRGTIFEAACQVSLAMHCAEGAKPASEPSIDPLWWTFGAITQSVEIYRNLITFHRGDNTYPSNLSFDLDHPQVRRIYRMIEETAQASPAPRDRLSRIDMNIWGRRYEEAARLAVQASEQHPRDVQLLHELIFLMVWANRPAERKLIQQRLDELPRN